MLVLSSYSNVAELRCFPPLESIQFKDWPSSQKKEQQGQTYIAYPYHQQHDYRIMSTSLHVFTCLLSKHLQCVFQTCHLLLCVVEDLACESPAGTILSLRPF